LKSVQPKYPNGTPAKEISLNQDNYYCIKAKFPLQEKTTQISWFSPIIDFLQQEW